jgi:hypothetical protein
MTRIVSENRSLALDIAVAAFEFYCRREHNPRNAKSERGFARFWAHSGT